MTWHRNVGLFVVPAAAWGFAFMAIKIGLEFFPLVLLAMLRYDVAGVAMFVCALYATDSPFPRSRAEWTRIAIDAMFLIAMYHALPSVGETDPTVMSAAAAVIVGLSPVLTTGFMRLLLPSERLTPPGVVGLSLGPIGIVVPPELDSGSSLVGGTVAKLLIFGTATTFALGSVLTHRVDSELSIGMMEAWSVLLGASLIRVASVDFDERPGAVTLNVQLVAMLVYPSLAVSTLGFLIYFDLLARLGPIEINLVSYVAPIFAAFSDWAFLNEAPTSSTVGGFTPTFLRLVFLKCEAIRRGPRY